MKRIERLRNRNTYGINQNMLNWASWLRVHHQDPTWEQHVVKDDAWNKMNFKRWEKYFVLGPLSTYKYY